MLVWILHGVIASCIYFKSGVRLPFIFPFIFYFMCIIFGPAALGSGIAHILFNLYEKRYDKR